MRTMPAVSLPLSSHIIILVNFPMVVLQKMFFYGNVLKENDEWKEKQTANVDGAVWWMAKTRKVVLGGLMAAGN